MCVNSLRVEYDCDIYITGSNAKLLSSELSTYLSGRYVEFTIYPFSYEEFMQLYLQVLPKSTPQQIFSKYLTTGGMPYLSNLRFANEPTHLYLQDLYNSVVLKDINLILENIIYMELIRRGYTVTIGKYSTREIDFIATKADKKFYFQVCYLLASADTIAREFSVYDYIRDNYPKYVLSLDEFDMSQNGIRHMNIKDFLLSQEV